VKFFKKNLREPFRRFKINPSFNTPVLKKRPKDIGTDGWIVVYPEITFGNPLGAKNVVRWLLHNPGFDPQTGKETKPYFYGKGELYFRIGNWFKDFQHPGSKTSRSFLQVFHFPLHLYNAHDAQKDRTGTAYLIRKGLNKKICHDLSESILIDGLSHEEIAKIFKRVKTFISYDSYTTFSHFAVLCGCESVVIPDDGITEGEWMPNSEDRYGLAYGFESLSKAQETSHLVLERYENFQTSSIASVKNFLTETELFFGESSLQNERE
jgi:hypothetical protein